MKQIPIIICSLLVLIAIHPDAMAQGSKLQKSYEWEVVATMDSEEDLLILDNYLEGLKVSLGTGHIQIDNRFWKNRITRGKKSTMELEYK